MPVKPHLLQERVEAGEDVEAGSHNLELKLLVFGFVDLLEDFSAGLNHKPRVMGNQPQR